MGTDIGSKSYERHGDLVYFKIVCGLTVADVLAPTWPQTRDSMLRDLASLQRDTMADIEVDLRRETRRLGGGE